jgi:hypothetical protein
MAPANGAMNSTSNRKVANVRPSANKPLVAAIPLPLIQRRAAAGAVTKQQITDTNGSNGPAPMLPNPTTTTNSGAAPAARDDFPLHAKPQDKSALSLKDEQEDALSRWTLIHHKIVLC